MIQFVIILVVFTLASCQEENNRAPVPRPYIICGESSGADVDYQTYGDTLSLEYHEFEDGVSDTVFFDVDMNGVDDYYFDSYYRFVAGSSVAKCRMVGLGNNQIVCNPSFGFADTLINGQLIDSILSFTNDAWFRSFSSVIGNPSNESEPWLGLGSHYVGFRLFKNMQYHYGWMGFTYVDKSTIVIRDVAFIM